MMSWNRHGRICSSRDPISYEEYVRYGPVRLRISEDSMIDFYLDIYLDRSLAIRKLVFRTTFSSLIEERTVS